MCVCVCDSAREREREKGRDNVMILLFPTEPILYALAYCLEFFLLIVKALKQKPLARLERAKCVRSIRGR